MDLIAQAWDTSPPHTFVVITADRDLAYAISTLRMRGYRVVVISPSGTHDIFAQASATIELTRALLGLKQDAGVDAFLNESVPTAHPTSSTTQYPTMRSTFGTHERPSGGFELHDLPKARARRDSFFSHSRKFDVFGGMEDIPATSDAGSFGLGGVPLFPRSQSRAEMQSRLRADSAPPNMFSTGAFPPYGENRNQSPNRPASKGKQREFPLDEPEDIAPYPGPFSHIPYSGSAFDPFGGERQSFKSRAMDSLSDSSASSTSKDSPFSLVQAPESNVETSTAPTSADTFPFTHNQPPRKAEIVIEVVNEPARKSPPPPPVNPAQTDTPAQKSPPISSSVNQTAKKATLSTGPEVKIPAPAQKISTPILVPPAPTNKVVQPPTVAAKEAAKPAMSSNAPPVGSSMVPPQAVPASSFKQAAPAISSNTPPIAGPSKAISTPNPTARPSVTPTLQRLVDALRTNGAMTQSRIGDALHAKGYSEYKTLKALLSAAFEQRIVERRPNEGKQIVWALTKRYA